MKPKNANYCQQEQTAIAGLGREIIALQKDINGHLETIVSLTDCTSVNDDPFSSGGNIPVPCCSGLEMKNKDWKNDDNWHYQCEKSTARCTSFHDDPYSSGGNVPMPCCNGLKMKNKDWNNDDKWHYQCEQSSASCTVLHDDPYSLGYLLPCCEGLYEDSQPWNGPDKKWSFQCEKKTTPTPVFSPSSIVPEGPSIHSIPTQVQFQLGLLF